jgi:murein DD-endopeptidase MepM/ murein hydrolase activator NlpD
MAMAQKKATITVVQDFVRRTPEGFITAPPIARPRLNLALLYLLLLIGSGVWIARGRIWEQRLHSPLDSTQLTEAPQLFLPELTKTRANRITHSVRTGEDLSRVFRRFGIDAFAEIEESLRALSIKEGKSLMPKPGRKVVISLTPRGSLRKLSYPLTKDSELEIAKKRTENGKEFQARIVSHPPLEVQVVARGEIQSSLSAAAQKARVPYEVIDQVVDLFGDRIDFRRDFKKGDRFTLVYREKLANNKLAGSGPVIAAVFNLDGKQLYALRYVGNDGKARYFDESGKVLGSSFLRYPVQFSKISSTFTEARFHPVLKVKRPHNGTDFAAPVGTPVRTVGDGQVVFAGYKGPAGNMVRIRHNDRYTTEYLHLSRIAPGIRRGSFVSKGQLIGAVGSTGLSTGPHLHYGLFDRGRYVDPMRAILPTEERLDRGKAIDRRYLSGLVATLQRYQTESLEDPALARLVTVVGRSRTS